MTTDRAKALLLLTAVVIAFVAITRFIQGRSPGIQQFRGVVRYPMLNLGGEGSSVKLGTTSGVFDLFLSPDLRRELNRVAKDGASVIVVGIAGKRGGIERREYDAIDVISIAPDVTATESLE